MNAWCAVAGLASLVAVLAFSSSGDDVGVALTRYTVWLSLAYYLAATLLMLRLTPAGWRGESFAGHTARWCWTWAVVIFVVHVAMAFHWHHNWSHAHAVEHTRQVAGWGEGVFVSYAFVLLWLADAAWWWASPSTFAARASWLHRSWHAFMLFIVFNGTVIFEKGIIQWLGALGLVVLAIAWWFAPKSSTSIEPDAAVPVT